MGTINRWRYDGDILSRIKGGLLGGAVGDALGGIIEFFSEETIFKEFGPDGITDYVDGKGYKRTIRRCPCLRRTA